MLDESANQAATHITAELKATWQKEIARFNAVTGNSLSLPDFIDKFIKKLAETAESRSIITALYSFVLEYVDIVNLIDTRSAFGGSLEPVLTCLFKGGLIFESLLKYLCPFKDGGAKIKTIGELIQNSGFTSLYVSRISTSANDLNEIIVSVTNNDLQTAFDTTAKLRNTTGHNLCWSDIFSGPQNFTKLFEQILNAILFIRIKSFP